MAINRIFNGVPIYKPGGSPSLIGKLITIEDLPLPSPETRATIISFYVACRFFGLQKESIHCFQPKEHNLCNLILRK